MNESTNPLWLALMIGNSRLHWAAFQSSRLVHHWDTPHLDSDDLGSGAIAPSLSEPTLQFPNSFEAMPSSLRQTIRHLFAHSAQSANSLPVWIASVVPQQLALWQSYPNARPITLEQIPIQGKYATLGIDRALAAWGACRLWGAPVLVIDAGTALTFTGLDAQDQLVGGAILLGLDMQGRSLHQFTANLPHVNFHPPFPLPNRWATETPEAIRSGILYSVLAGIRDFVDNWWNQFPDSAVVLTGGDASTLSRHLHDTSPHLAERIYLEPNLIFYGIQAIQAKTQQNPANSDHFNQINHQSLQNPRI
ncbi:MAG: pantothenate kinase [Elainellaceae cyanobacterium]